MRLPFRKTEADKRITAARTGLDAARAQLIEVDAEESAALGDSVAYAAWREKRAAVVAEVERHERLVEALEAGAEATRVHDEAEAERKVLAAARDDVDLLVKRIRGFGALAEQMLQLATECARQELAANVLNARLPVGEKPIPIASVVARDFGAEPRQDIPSRDIELWVAETTGTPIGDQSAVASTDGIHGQVQVMGGTMRWKCVKRVFRETKYHPRTLFDWPGSIHQSLRLPRFDAPGTLFDGSLLTIEAVAALDVAAAVKPAKRKPRAVQVELVPIDPTWPPVSVVGQAERNVAI